ncbi:MAG: hypothetical protein Q7S68_04285 [Deltaproteobacteria bacterium]|nr:hypothetical protein [Deltaproteobacteria bacterium]
MATEKNNTAKEEEEEVEADEDLEEVDFDESDPVCPNCGQATEGETTCPHCGAILSDEDELDPFVEDDGSY